MSQNFSPNASHREFVFLALGWISAKSLNGDASADFRACNEHLAYMHVIHVSLMCTRIDHLSAGTDDVEWRVVDPLGDRNETRSIQRISGLLELTWKEVHERGHLVIDALCLVECPNKCRFLLTNKRCKAPQQPTNHIISGFLAPFE